MNPVFRLLICGLIVVANSVSASDLAGLAAGVQPKLIEHVSGGVAQPLELTLKTSTQLNRSTHLIYQTTGYQMELAIIDQGEYVECNGTILSGDGLEHCVTVDLAFPVANIGSYRWDKNIDDSESSMSRTESYSEYVDVFTMLPPDGAFNVSEGENGGYGDRVGMGKMSYYPLASISSMTNGYSWGVDMGLPLVFRLSLDPNRGMVAEFDLGISPATTKFPNRSHFKLYLFKHDPDWGFRSALTSYYAIQKDFFKKRVEHEGIWLPFTALMTIDNWEDFGFGFHETHHPSTDRGLDPAQPTIEADKLASEVYSFQYTEPWDIQIAINTLDSPYDEVIGAETIPSDHLEYLAGSVTLDKQGLYQARRLETPWFDSGWAVSITTNVDPELPSPNRFDYVMDDEIEPAVKMDADGIYFDSMEWNWHHDLNYNKAHFQYADYPLTFSKSLDTPRPAIWNYSSEYEMMNQISSEMHSAGKLVMGNGFGWTPFAAGILDLFGAEFSWFNAADYDSRILQFRRSISYQKPIVVLLNEGFSDDAFTKAPFDGYRVYFERMLFYGFFPSFFSADASNDPYWADPKNYNQGRPYFKKYIPLIQTIASAGWEPITYTTSTASNLGIERFGPTGSNIVYLTLLNKSDADIQTTLRVDYKALGLSKKLSVQELIGGEAIPSAKVKRKRVEIPVSIPKNSTRLIAISEN
ncbi:MAG: hypothetical protein HQ508_05095 [Candidatus Marinimicrobia bacterium]|nr:hypothetical protein [Candidatus Neomarinimicrobiota bacterium]